MRLLKNIIKFIISIITKIFGWFIFQNPRAWFCIPGDSLKDVTNNILNYTHDNINSFIHHVSTYHDDNNIKIHLIIHSKERYKELNNFAFQLKYIRIKYIYIINPIKFNVFLLIKNYIIFYFYFYSSKYIIYQNVMDRYYKLKRQTSICINYYTPFKLDLKHNPKLNNIDYVIMSSNSASQIDSIASHISYLKYRNFGRPKDDHIIKPRFTKNEVCKKLGFNDNIKKIVLYLPTHRDYERINAVERNIFGYTGDYSTLNNILIKHNAMLIIKIHIAQKDGHILFINNLSNIQLYQSSYEYMVDDIMPYTDLLITDYSSVSFDFMLTGKPIIYNFFDVDVYKETRGFSWDPVEIICAGPIVKTKDEFEIAIDENLSNNDNKFNEKYNWVCQLTHAYTDGNSCERIYSFLMQLMNKNIK